jgi:hypothetical protein
MRTFILKKRQGYLQHLAVILFCFLVVSCSIKPDKELHFAFIGDLHYSVPDSLKTDSLVQSVAKELNSLPVKPEFIIQTGDFFHGSKGVNIQTEAAMAFRHFARDIGIPFFISKGNHDSRIPYEKCAFPIFSRELGSDVLKSYYSFDKANCHFIMLDCTEEDLPGMLLWLEKDLKTTKSNPKIEHIFAAGHYPLWIVARAGFTTPEYATRVASLLAKYKADAYFCGHTHNKTVTVRLVDNQPVTQIMDASVVEKGRLFMLAPFMYHVNTKPSDNTQPGILPLEEGHQILIPKSQLKYYWGYQEGSSTSYYSFTVSGKSVKADWYVLGQGLVRSFKWDEPGKLTDLKSPAKTEKELLSDNDFTKISKAWLYAAPWIEKDSVAAPITINGIKAGTIKINSIKMAGSPFWNKIEVPLNEPAIEAIKINNEISITYPENAKFGLAHIFLLVQFKDGRFARSNIAPKVLTSFDPSGGDYDDFPARELIDSVNTGNSLARVFLSFNRFY